MMGVNVCKTCANQISINLCITNVCTLPCDDINLIQINDNEFSVNDKLKLQYNLNY